MIRLFKAGKPLVLVQNEQRWTDTILAALQAGRRVTEGDRKHYRHPEIKAALISETNGKCAYCESKVLHVTFGEVEHIVAKSKRPELTFEWENLTLGCPSCNNLKRDTEGCIDPYKEEPSDHLEFFGVFVAHKAGSTLGTFTERVLKLNRVELIERRTVRMRQLIALRDLLYQESDPERRKVLEEDIRNHEAAPSQEYAAMSRAFLTQVFGPLPESTPSAKMRQPTDNGE